jgi:hypothetical protein
LNNTIIINVGKVPRYGYDDKYNNPLIIKKTKLDKKRKLLYVS